VERLIATFGSLLLTLAGVALITILPVTRSRAARDQADIQRALVPLLEVSLDTLRSRDGHGFELNIPADDQWTRLVKHLGTPTFLIVPATPRTEPNRHTLASATVGLDLHATRNGVEAKLTPTNDTPYLYSSYTANNGFALAANSGDRIGITARVSAAAVPPGSILFVVPNWQGFSLWDWAEGAPIGALISQFGALLACGAGLVCLLAAGALAFGRPAD
jgi:hypothetical protein